MTFWLFGGPLKYLLFRDWLIRATQVPLWINQILKFSLVTKGQSYPYFRHFRLQ